MPTGTSGGEPVADVVTPTRRQEYALGSMLGQRIFGMALAYEDVNDHEQLRSDPLFGAALGKLESQRADCAGISR